MTDNIHAPPLAIELPLPDGLAWAFKRFDELTLTELYELLGLRQRVFVVEQRAFFPDVDGFDQIARHLLLTDGAGTLLGYARLFPPADGGAGQIGRVVLAPEARGSGLGRTLMAEAMRRIEGLAPGARIDITAQAHLAMFYGSFGFVQAGEVQDLEGIPHIPMTRI